MSGCAQGLRGLQEQRKRERGKMMVSLAASKWMTTGGRCDLLFMAISNTCAMIADRYDDDNDGAVVVVVVCERMKQCVLRE